MIIFIKDGIPFHNTHELPFMYNLGLYCQHVNFKLIKILTFHVIESLVYIIITNKIILCPLLSAGFRLQICLQVPTSSCVRIQRMGGGEWSRPSFPFEKFIYINTSSKFTKNTSRTQFTHPLSANTFTCINLHPPKKP